MQEDRRLFANSDGEFEPEADEYTEDLEDGFGDDEEEEEEVIVALSSDDDDGKMDAEDEPLTSEEAAEVDAKIIELKTAVSINQNLR